MLLLKPSKDDFITLGFYLGRIITAFGLVLFIPLITAVIFREWDPALDFTIAMLVNFFIGISLQKICFDAKELNWITGLVVVAMSWLVAMFLGAIPLFLSGHYMAFVDACFDSMSGIATTGLALIQDLDHLSHSHNMWRHLLMFLGGQGIIVIGLTFLIRGSGGAYKMYVGEAREEKILPNVIQTARFIWGISIFYLIFGTALLTLVAYFIGLPLIKAFLHGLWIFMAAFDTGGFTPQSQSILYYHDFLFELITIVFMILGTLNFAIHYALWNRNFSNIIKNFELRTLLSSMVITSIFMGIGLYNIRTYPNLFAFFRKGIYQLISAHSGTGYMTVYAPQFSNEWIGLGFLMIVIAMGLGGSACSTAGGIKALRVGVMIKSLIAEIKKILSPGGAVIIEKFYHIKETILDEKIVRAAFIIFACYVFTYVLGAGIGVFYGYPIHKATFESVSAAANVGLSCGITDPSMPLGLKICFIIQMWLGRLEFLAVFGLIGFIIAEVKGK